MMEHFLAQTAHSVVMYWASGDVLDEGGAADDALTYSILPRSELTWPGACGGWWLTEATIGIRITLPALELAEVVEVTQVET